MILAWNTTASAIFGRLRLEIYPLAFEDHRPVADLPVDSQDIFTDYAEEEELYASKKEKRDDEES